MTGTQIPAIQNLDAIRRSANAIFKLLTASGPATLRPTPLFVGQPYFDTTLGQPIWWSGTIWVTADGKQAPDPFGSFAFGESAF